MGLKKFAIIPDHPVYYSGQTISGRLVVEIDKPMSMKAIHLKYSGKGTVRWTETRRINKTTYIESFTKKERYVAQRQIVFGNDNEDSELAEGEHVFDFNCELPMNSPSSFEGVYGSVRYSVKARINRHWKFNHVTKHPLTVMSVFDLNHNASATVPVVERASKTFWGHSDPLAMSVNLPVRGFVSGQIIPIKVSLNNASGVEVKSLRVSLKQIVTFHVTSSSRTVKTCIVKNEFPVPEGFRREEIPLNLELPVVAPSYIEFCKIIDLEYQLNVTANVNAWYHKNLKIRTEVIVGNIPLMNHQTPIRIHKELSNSGYRENPSCSQDTDYQPPSYSFIIPPGMMYKDLPPPTYEQCMRMENCKEENSKSERWERNGI